jgi:flagellum-specific peptidoglycan hydrolase FlgJ
MLTQTQTLFLNKTTQLAQRVAPQYSLDWRLMAAAAILESGWGESNLARNANNFFGITAARTTPTNEVILVKNLGVTRRFRRYETEEAAFHAYGKLLGQSRIYARARESAHEAALREMISVMSPVYCPDDPDYELKLTQLIELIEKNPV